MVCSKKYIKCVRSEEKFILGSVVKSMLLLLTQAIRVNVMIKNRIKNGFLIFLIVLTVYQINKLWFENLANHNFFYTLFSGGNTTIKTEDINRAFYTPTRIISSDGNNNYYMFYSNLKTILDEHKFGNISREFGSLEYKSEYKFDSEETLGARSFIYEYEFGMKTRDFFESIGVKNNNIINKVEEFNKLILIPGRDEISPLKVIFLNMKDNIAYEYTTKSKNFIYLFDWIDGNKENRLGFVLNTDLSAGNNFLFVPYWTNYYYYYLASVRNPYKNSNGEERISFVDNEINNFFDNPSAKNSKTSPKEETDAFGNVSTYDTYVFNDSMLKVLTYYAGERSYLEFSDYKTPPKKDYSLVGSYNIATNFIMHDENVINDIHLMKIDYNEQNSYTFYFSYSVGDALIYLSDDFKEKSGMENHIEISTSGGMITKYKKSLLNYELSDERNFVSEAYKDVLDTDFLRGFDMENDIIRDFSLSYKTDISQDTYSEYYNDIELYWFIVTDDVRTNYPAKK